ncbi:hypothetical protein GRI62_06960 [Erythrobacter arachoides]|uniref:Uncharacterized protein n=1 Tax=Aurantiacibacter arachoides TaxID=1850444 RepID=A0A844ZZM1_9SPHN|nr:hypothetical protein [Aurantiacibacter arachoides]MXO93345.1 hypothetical protein [Aurantiacibacter arachoides]GGD50117.1 hypothetical protein GCM10011411_07370 [Aurantiacibacter arachoides]
MATLSKPPIPLKMYKHFAVVTLTLTAGIAMFADSDNREAMAQQVEDHQQDAELGRASAERVGSGELERRDLEGGGAFGNEDAGYGEPGMIVRPVGRSGGRRRPGATTRIAIPGYTPEQIAALSEADYSRLVAALPPQQRFATDTAPSAADVTAIERASARRAGGSNMGADAPG